MELRPRTGETEKGAGTEKAQDARKRRRSNRRENTVDVKRREREDMRCVIEGDLWDNSTGSEYEPHSDEEEGSEGDVSLEVESNLEGEHLETGCREEDFRGTMAEGNCGGEESEKRSGSKGTVTEGGLGRSPVVGDGRRARNEGGKGKSEIWREKASRDRSTVVADDDVVLRSRCTLKKLVAVNGRMTARQREAVEGTVLSRVWSTVTLIWRDT